MGLTALDKLRLFLRAPGQGIYTPSTGGGYAARLQQKLYGTTDPKQILAAWDEGFQKIRRVESILLGVPSDTGAGIMKGANFGPIGVREAYLEQYGSWPKTVLDLGDILCVPHFLHDEMLSPEQRTKTQKELYPGQGESLPVSPLSITEAVLKACYELNPQAKIFLIGGDHSVSWPAMVYCHQRFGKSFGVLHFDAHTDLMQSRLGVDYCFATWAYQSLRFLEPYHLVQVGIRSSSKTKAQWAELHPVLQFWAHEVVGKENEVIAQICQHFSDKGIRQIYISNDIDGTDSKEASATGTPEPQGLKSEFVKKLIAEVKRQFDVFGGDVVEVAPPLSGVRDFKTEPTCRLGAQYLHELVKPS
ncbi:arginase family protein [bacterium]|nr:arginase family protein [bacterium]NBX82038.1 arginase family protein [bacterium]